jgi:outer membrane lipoprotein-sorting protein
MKKRLVTHLALVLLALGHASVAAAAMDDARAIVERANVASYYAGDDGRSAARMLIEDGNGNRQQRQFTLLRKDVSDGGDQRYLVVFSRPADIRGTVFRVEKHVGADDDRWLYLPALDLVKRIAAGDKRTSFVGSHFFYEDISGRGLDEDSHRLVETTDEHYIIESTPKAPAEVAFARYRTWIDRESFLPMKTEYQRQSGEVYRRMEVTRVETIDGYPTGTEVRMSDLDSGGYTITQFRFSQYDVGLPDDIFSERSLRNPPRRWLRRSE